MKNFEVVIKKEITLSRVGDLLCSAFESGSYGSGYWAEIIKYKKPFAMEFYSNASLGRKPGEAAKVYPHIDYPLNPGGALTIRDTEEENPKKATHVLNYECIKKGLKAWATDKEYASSWADFLSENDDGSTADIFLQFCLFGKVIYG